MSGVRAWQVNDSGRQLAPDPLIAGLVQHGIGNSGMYLRFQLQIFSGCSSWPSFRSARDTQRARGPPILE
jgi:hypothetical protein